MSITVPSKFHTLLEPFLSKNLEMTVAAQDNKITITLTAQSNPAETFLHDENTSAKLAQPNKLQFTLQH
jgi:hypothetical protein